MNGQHALIIVDLQPDFLPGGPLGVHEGEQIIPIVLELLPHFDLVVATQDWHPPDHGSFAANHAGRSPGELIELDGLTQILWPVHCVQDSVGAQLVPELRERELAAVFRKGTDRGIDSYSGFFDNGRRRSTGLGDYLTAHKILQVYVLGLATDYCVKFTALDARRLGFEVFVVEDGCRAVNLAPGDGERALAEMRQAGCTVLASDAVE